MKTLNTENVIAVAVVTAARQGVDYIDVEHLTSSERWEVARQLGWNKTFSHAYLQEWIYGPSKSIAESASTRREHGPDYEGMILSEQEEDPSTWG